MSKIIILGIILSVIIFIPRLIKKIPEGTFSGGKPTATGKPTTQPTKTATTKGTTAPTKAPPTTKATKTAAAVPAGRTDETVRRLQAKMKKLWELLQAEKKAREAADKRVMKMVRSMMVSRQIEHLRAKVEAKKYHVPEWNAPYCFKAKLKAGDQAKYVKIGTGLVSPASDDEDSRLAYLIGDMLLFFLHKEKLKQVRLYRETTEHARLLSDAVPPEKRDPNGAANLKIGSPHLDSTLQCTYSVADNGKVKIKAQLFNIPKGTLLYETEKANEDYERAVRAVAETIAGLDHVQMKASNK